MLRGVVPIDKVVWIIKKLNNKVNRLEMDNDIISLILLKYNTL